MSFNVDDRVQSTLNGASKGKVLFVFPDGKEAVVQWDAGATVTAAVSSLKAEETTPTDYSHPKYSGNVKFSDLKKGLEMRNVIADTGVIDNTVYTVADEPYLTDGYNYASGKKEQQWKVKLSYNSSYRDNKIDIRVDDYAFTARTSTTPSFFIPNTVEAIVKFHNNFRK